MGICFIVCYLLLLTDEPEQAGVVVVLIADVSMKCQSPPLLNVISETTGVFQTAPIVARNCDAM